MATGLAHAHTAGIGVFERRGHLGERRGRKQLATEQPLFPTQQVLGGGVQRARREGDAHMDEARVHQPVLTSRVTLRRLSSRIFEMI